MWPHEARDFTPWLLQNADVLGDLLGMDLILEIAEHPVGGFRLDLKGRDQSSGETVIVENQLQPSDHTHLGQLLTYAAGTDPTTVVWIAASIRPEHRAALDWLNTRTDEDTRFFGVELGVVRIGDSQPAPAFRLVAEPNDWEKTVRAATNQADALSGKQQLYREFWTRWLGRLRAEQLHWSGVNRPPKDNWLRVPTGVSNATYYTTFTKQGLSSELVFESADAAINTARLNILQTQKASLEAAYGSPLEWQAIPSRKSTRIADYLPGADVENAGEWNDYIDWLLDRQIRLRRAISSVGGAPDAIPS